jgi:hypothetical protein
MLSHLRPSAARFALLGVLTVAVGLSAPALSVAGQVGAGAEERASRAAERATGAEERASLRAQRRQERAAAREAHEHERLTRREAREHERTARREARAQGHGTPVGEPGNTPGGSVHEPAAPQRRTCRLSLTATADRIVVGESAVLGGKLACPERTSAAGVPVTAYLRQHQTGRTELATVTTAEDGSFELTPTPLQSNGVFYVRAPGARGAHAAVRVAPAVSVAGPAPGAAASAASGHLRLRLAMRAAFTGAVSPASSGARVILQIAYPAAGEHWRAVAFGAVNPDGSYSIAHSFRTPGAVSVRTVVRTGPSNTPGISEVLSYEVAQPQNPLLTIQTSADPVPSGESVAITGVAAAVNTPVTLLARIKGGTFSPVATETTDATGHYSFTQQPLQNTYYEVIDAGQQSTPLFEGTTLAVTPGVTPAALQADEQLTTFSGTVNTLAVGHPVYLEREYASGTAFHVIAVATVDGEAQYSLVRALPPGVSTLRIKLPGDGVHLASTSEPFTITVGS